MFVTLRISRVMTIWFFFSQGRQPTFAQKVRKKYQRQQNKKAQKLKKRLKNSKGKGKQKSKPKKNSSMTKVKLKEMSKASQKRQRDSLAVTALENATVAALQVNTFIYTRFDVLLKKYQFVSFSPSKIGRDVSGRQGRHVIRKPIWF